MNPRIVLLALGMIALGTDAFLVAGVLPVIARETGVSEGLVGQLITVIAQTKWLPEYQEAIPGADERLEEAEYNGTRVRLRETRGAARLKTRSVEETGTRSRRSPYERRCSR